MIFYVLVYGLYCYLVVTFLAKHFGHKERNHYPPKIRTVSVEVSKEQFDALAKNIGTRVLKTETHELLIDRISDDEIVRKRIAQ